MAGMEHFVQHAHAHVHTNTHLYAASVSHDVSRRSSRQILFRKIGLPLSSTTERQQLCVGGSFQPTNTYVTCVRACVRARVRLKNFRDYHPNLLPLQHSIFPFSLLRARPRYLTNFQYISTTRNDIACNVGYRQTIGSRNPRFPISDNDIAKVCATFLYVQIFTESIVKMSRKIVIYNFLFF